MGGGQQRKATDDRWWVPDRNIGRKEGREGGGGGVRKIKQHRVIKIERGRYRKIEGKGKTQCSREGGTERKRQRVSLRRSAARPAFQLYLQCSLGQGLSSSLTLSSS